jgi:hypothetical protein
MKTFLLTCTAFVICQLNLHAQMAMAGFQLGNLPDASFSIATEDSEHSFSPAVAEGSFNNLVIGGGLGLAKTGRQMGLHLSMVNATLETDAGTIRLKGIAPAWHTNFYLNATRPLALGITLRLGFGSLKTSFTDTVNYGFSEEEGPFDVEVKYRGITYQVGLGGRYVFANESMAVFANAIYGIQAQKPKSVIVDGNEYAADDFNGVDLSTAGIEFGLYYFFMK